VRLPFIVGASILAFACLEPVLVRWLGGWWGELASLVLTGAPIGMASGAARDGTGLRGAWKTGLLFAFASAALYAWIFTGAWV
jgi:hypothetical protein